MKRNIYILVLILALVTAFFARFGWSKVKEIPEISNALYDDVLGDPLKDTNIARTIIPIDSNLVFFTCEGKIYRFNLEKRMLDFLVDLNTAVEPEITYHGNTVVLKEKNSANLILFDLKKMAAIELPRKIKADKIISLDTDHEIMGYLTGRRLVFMNYQNGVMLKELNTETVVNSGNESKDESSGQGGDTVFYNSADTLMAGVPKTLVLTSPHLYIFDKRQNSLETIKLAPKASSGFLLDEGVIYYGSENRELVKFSLTARKILWQFKLADQLKIEPQKAGPYIIITPEDHNIYFFNKRGTLYWWEKLDSTRLLPPVVMNENVSVFLWNKTIKFFNYKNKSFYSYPFDKSVLSDALHIDEYLYVIAETGDEDQGRPLKAIYKIGNNFGVVIQTDPQDIIPMGKSIKFNLEKFNLVNPELKIRILDAGNVNVFEKTISYKDDPSFVWIPNRAMVYKLVVEINAENKKGLLIEHPFEVINVEKQLYQYYYRLQKSSNEDHVVCDPDYRQTSFYPMESEKIKKNEKARAIPARKKS